MKSMHIQNFIHPQTYHELDIIAEDPGLIHQFADTLVDADAVIGAQFYYTNPLLFLIVEGEMNRHAPLYGDYYLLRIEDWLHLELKYPIIAINNLFSEKIGNPKEIFNTFNMETFREHREADGLYIIGINVKEMSRG